MIAAVSDWPLYYRIPLSVALLLAAFVIAVIIGNVLEMRRRRWCNCPNCQAWRAGEGSEHGRR